jgi:hypothetical protein
MCAVPQLLGESGTWPGQRVSQKAHYVKSQKFFCTKPIDVLL